MSRTRVHNVNISLDGFAAGEHVTLAAPIFIDASPAEALEQARRAANGQDVRLGGGPSTIRQFLQADLVDFMHLVTVPLVLGSGVSLWNGLAGMHERYDIEFVAAPSGQVHQFWHRKSH